MEMMMMMVMSGEIESSASEEFEFSKSNPQIVKRKRTKRRRLAASISSSSGGGGQSEEDRNSTVMTSEEDEDMANCLILLARGGGDGVFGAGSGTGDFSGVDLVVKSVGQDTGKTPERKRKVVSRKSVDASSVSGEMSFTQLYECNTCEKRFQSFQALGGHRASHHKKAKLTAEDGAVLDDIIKQEQVQDQFLVKPHPVQVPVKPSSTAIPVSASVPPPSFISLKSHECAICGSAFSSGQALGGHMRRHRAVATTTTAATPTVAETSSSMSRPSFLSLDLNLPAPVDDEHHHHVVSFHHHRQQFQIHNSATGSVTAPLVFSAPALVDCYF